MTERDARSLLPGKERTMVGQQELRPEPPSHCPKCDGVPRLYLRLPNTRKGTVAYIYRCEKCSELIWDD